MDKNRTGLLAAGSAVLMVLSWQYVTVRYNYAGNWSALFYIGDAWPLPPELSSENVRVFQNDPGYDGVFYHLVAHDPWFARGFFRFADNSSLRWRRILVPGLAHTAALGRDAWIHSCYISMNLLFIFAGAWWLGQYCASNQLSASWGLAFLAVPSVLVSTDRLTIDTALAALTVGLMYYECEERHGRSLALLALCPLARETGLYLTAGRALQHASQREWRKVFLCCATAFPFVIWSLFVFFHTPRDDTSWLSLPFAGILRRTLHPIQYPITGRWVALAAVLDYLALIGMWIALAFTVRWAMKRRFGPLESCIYAFAFGAVWLGNDPIWAGAYEFGRTMSPLFILLGLLAIRERDGWLLLPLASVLPRVFLQFEPQVRGILRHAWTHY